MVERFLLWLGAGAVCAGVTVGMLAGAATASAQTDADGDGAAKTSQSAKPAENQQDSGHGEAAKKSPRHTRNFAADETDAKPTAGTETKAADAADDSDEHADGKNEDAVTDDAVARNGRKPSRPEAGKRTGNLINDVIVAVTHLPDRKAVFEKPRRTDPVETQPVKTSPAEADPVDTGPAETVNRQSADVVAIDPVARLVTSQTRSNLALATPVPAPPTIAGTGQVPVPPVISAIGTLVFGLISLAESVIEGPPMALPGSGVTVKRSTLVIDEGHEVPADWYFPEGSLENPPDRIIYLQHGFLARGVFYDYTASYLAKETNSIVVAPTLTSNIFATDGMWLGGDPMHQAVANLFLNGNTALLDSAIRAGYPEAKADDFPTEAVLVGHSLGGGLVIDTARYISADAPSADDFKLAGVLMLDGVSFTDPVPILRDIPTDIPVYNLSATPYFWNLFGTMDAALAQVRPNDFHGAQLLGGLHSDSMIGGNPLIQVGAYLFTGFSPPSNAQGSQILAAAWINDMFDGPPTPCATISCYSGQPGDTFTIPTPFGPAIGLVQPTPGVFDTLARQLNAVFIGLLSHIDFATDVAAPQETAVAA